MSKEEIDARVKEVAETVGLSAALDRQAARLSVNDLQKVALGRSMIMRPTIFLLDEPFSNLDSAFRAYMRAELKRIQHEVGQTMVYVTHDQVEAMGMADQIAVMDRGELQQYGSPDDLYERPANTFVARFIGSVLNNFLPARYADGALHLGDGQRRSRRAPRRLREPASARPHGHDPAGARARRRSPAPRRRRSAARWCSSSRSGRRTSCTSSTTGRRVRVVAAARRPPRDRQRARARLRSRQVHVFDDATGLAVR